MLGNCTNLTRVELNDNNLTYLSGHLFKNNRNLEYLYLQNNRLKKLLKRSRKKNNYNCFNLNLVGFKSHASVASILAPKPCLRHSEPWWQSHDYRDKFPKGSEKNWKRSSRLKSDLVNKILFPKFYPFQCFQAIDEFESLISHGKWNYEPCLFNL